MQRYVRETKRSPAETVDRKGKDLSIRLYRGYRQLAPVRGQIYLEAQRRHATGQGTRVRKSIREAYAGRGLRKQQGIYKQRVALSPGAQAVKRELGARARGSNFNAIRVLFRNWRPKGTAQGTEVATTRYGVGGRAIKMTSGNGNVATVRIVTEKDDSYEAIEQRHHVQANAVNAARVDTELYLANRQQRKEARTLKRLYAPKPIR